MRLSLAIPVHNDTEALAHLLGQAVELGCFEAVVVTDDGSDPPLDPDRLRRIADRGGIRLTLLRNDTPQGAGQARNRALEHIGSSHVLFFDSDDMLTGEIPALWHDLAGRSFDFCLFRHADSQVAQGGRWGQIELDDAFWRLGGCSSQTLHVLPEAAFPWLAQTANYPWNKIYRTDFLRENDIRFSEIPIHNDILAHWLSFLRAGCILTTSRVGAVHFIRQGSHRLTNRRDLERLRAFEPLSRIARIIRQDDGPAGPWMTGFLQFSCLLIDWIRGSIDTRFHQELDRKVTAFLDACLDRDAMALLARGDPVLALRVTLLLGFGRI
ncbi:glycosyltransferase family 2 protein [Paracoccus sp. (in: a-proteobacteria)]|uniref:glycosyltransferase family 2 protein n=1 Tax=Paracoccus sp. TaxID=267 RepID=UPI003A85426F